MGWCYRFINYINNGGYTMNNDKKIKFGENEIIVSNLYPYRYEYGKGNEVLRIDIPEESASFDNIKKLDGFEETIYYYENDMLKQPYEHYSVGFSCQYQDGTYSVELKRLNETERLVQKLAKEIGVQDIIIANLTLNEAKEYQIDFVGKQCSESIYKGIDVETSLGVEHFSLDDTDQSNILALYNMQSSIGQNVIYHADGKECREFAAVEFNKIAMEARDYITACTTKFNFLKTWINRSESKEEVLSIEFTSELPEDLKEAYNAISTSV